MFSTRCCYYVFCVFWICFMQISQGLCLLGEPHAPKIVNLCILLYIHVCCQCILSYLNCLECVGRCINSDFAFPCAFTTCLYIVFVGFLLLNIFFAHFTGLCLSGELLHLTRSVLHFIVHSCVLCCNVVTFILSS
jgi:hypothetical protein